MDWNRPEQTSPAGLLPAELLIHVLSLALASTADPFCRLALRSEFQLDEVVASGQRALQRVVNSQVMGLPTVRRATLSFGDTSTWDARWKRQMKEEGRNGEGGHIHVGEGGSTDGLESLELRLSTKTSKEFSDLAAMPARKVIIRGEMNGTAGPRLDEDRLSYVLGPFLLVIAPLLSASPSTFRSSNLGLLGTGRDGVKVNGKQWEALDAERAAGCKKASEEETLSMSMPSVDACAVQLTEYLKDITPDLTFLVNIPYFPGLFDGTKQLSIHIDTHYFPDERRLRRQFRVQNAKVVTQKSFHAWARSRGLSEKWIQDDLKSTWIDNEMELKRMRQRKSTEQSANGLNPPIVRIILSGHDPKRAGIVVQAQHATLSCWALSSRDERNIDLDWAAYFATLLERKPVPLAQHKAKAALACANDPKWVSRALEVAWLYEQGPGANVALRDPMISEVVTLIEQGLKGLGLDPKHAGAIWLYSNVVLWSHFE
ncbi:hypothetical protein P7C70_g3977, partial [Phenoliferia sp. Uapishka_3]